jgi:hypothetical protein
MSVNTIHIEIDCAPGSSRPGQHFIQILTIISKNDNQYISNLGKRLLEKNMEPESKKFGNWEWTIPLNNDEILFSEEITEIWKTQLINLYNSSAIRYASWI